MTQDQRDQHGNIDCCLGRARQTIDKAVKLFLASTQPLDPAIAEALSYLLEDVEQEVQQAMMDLDTLWVVSIDPPQASEAIIL
jgi:hypothetical protein